MACAAGRRSQGLGSVRELLRELPMPGNAREGEEGGEEAGEGGLGEEAAGCVFPVIAVGTGKETG